jgi:hypothetical protein
VWLSRRILALLMVAGHIISCFMTRQMEYDADSCEMKLAGSDTFASTMRRLGELGRAVADSGPYMQTELALRRLPVDLPLFLVTWQRTRLRPATLENERTHKRASLFDTHPSDDERLAAAARANARGILAGGDESATALFHDFDWLSRHATRHHYEERGLLDEVRLVDAVESVQASVGRDERQQALQVIFDAGVSRYRGLTLAWPSTPQTPAPVTGGHTPAAPDAVDRFNDLVKQHTMAVAAQELLRTECGAFEPAPFGLSAWTLDCAMAKERELFEQMAVLEREIAPYEHERMERIGRGLGRLAASDDRAFTAAHLAALVQALNTAAAVLDAGVELARLDFARGVLSGALPLAEQPDTARARRDALTRRIDTAVARMHQVLAAAPCPVLLGTGAATLEDACDLGTSRHEPGRLVAGAERLYARLLFELCWLAIRGEQVDAPQPATR